MNKVGIREEIKQLIDKETDLVILETIKELLIIREDNPVYKNKLISRALQAEEDIKAGKVYSEEEFFKKSKERFGGK